MDQLLIINPALRQWLGCHVLGLLHRRRFINLKRLYYHWEQLYLLLPSRLVVYSARPRNGHPAGNSFPHVFVKDYWPQRVELLRRHRQLYPPDTVYFERWNDVVLACSVWSEWLQLIWFVRSAHRLRGGGLRSRYILRLLRRILRRYAFGLLLIRLFSFHHQSLAKLNPRRQLKCFDRCYLNSHILRKRWFWWYLYSLLLNNNKWSQHFSNNSAIHHWSQHRIRCLDRPVRCWSVHSDGLRRLRQHVRNLYSKQLSYLYLR
jgi:hypothetical protein